MRKLKVVFCGYREWATRVFQAVADHPGLERPIIITSKEDYDAKINSLPEDLDFILFVGWSWIVPKDILRRYLCLGIHPSDLPHFRGGSPLQHQIIQGIKKTKVTLMTLADQIDAGEIWLKEDLSLEGDSMQIVFDNLAESCVQLLKRFFEIFDSVAPERQELKMGASYKRRGPEDSRLTLDQMKSMSLEEVFNFIRCLTDPYPNAFIEDADGNRLYIKAVGFEKGPR